MSRQTLIVGSHFLTFGRRRKFTQRTRLNRPFQEIFRCTSSLKLFLISLNLRSVVLLIADNQTFVAPNLEPSNCKTAHSI